MNWPGRTLQRLMYVAPFIFAIIIVYILNMTSPLSIGPGGILAIFILLYAFFLSLFFAVIYLATKLLTGINKKIHLPQRKAYYLATVLAFMPVFLLALNSIGQLGFLDVVLTLVLVSVAGFYVMRRTE